MNLGRKYRVNDPESSCDGRIGVLEFVEGSRAWIVCEERLVEVKTKSLTDSNVLQEDMARYRARLPPLLEWEDTESMV